MKTQSMKSRHEQLVLPLTFRRDEVGQTAAQLWSELNALSDMQYEQLVASLRLQSSGGSR
jgi:hypothetical protein